MTERSAYWRLSSRQIRKRVKALQNTVSLLTAHLAYNGEDGPAPAYRFERLPT